MINMITLELFITTRTVSNCYQYGLNNKLLTPVADNFLDNICCINKDVEVKSSSNSQMHPDEIGNFKFTYIVQFGLMKSFLFKFQSVTE